MPSSKLSFDVLLQISTSTILEKCFLEFFLGQGGVLLRHSSHKFSVSPTLSVEVMPSVAVRTGVH